MSDKNKTFAAPAPKNMRSKRPSTVSVAATSSRTRINSSALKEKSTASRPKIDANNTINGEADLTMYKEDGSMPDFDAEYRQVAYGKFLRGMLQDCLVHEKFQREETQMDIQMAQLADRFQKTTDQLDKTSRRLKDLSFIVEEKRLLDLKNLESNDFYEMTDKSKAEEILRALNATEQASLDRLDTKNVDFGYNKESGHKQLLDAVNDAITGLVDIKKHSNLDMNKFKEYEKSRQSLEELEKDRFDIESLKSDFEAKFPKFGEKLLKQVSDQVAKMIEKDDDEDDDDDDDDDDD